MDLSFSMVHEGRWGPMKQTALALSHLVQTRFRQDALEIIGFNLIARRLTPVQLAEVGAGVGAGHEPPARADARRRGTCAGTPTPSRSCWSSPTASRRRTCCPTARREFRWPTTRETLRATVAQVDEIVRWGATLNLFMLGEDPGLARFVDAIARRSGGRVFTPDIGRLGEYVVADYLRARRGRR